MTTELPAFLHGCFDWRENGLQWRPDPDIGLLSRAALSSTNPWIVLAAVTEHAKQGDHSHARLLRPFFHLAEPFALARVSLLVYADIAPSKELAALGEVLESDDLNGRYFAAQGAALAGQLSLVPAMLDAWLRAEGAHDHELIGYSISDMLETEMGELADQVIVWRAKPRAPTPEDSPAVVRLLEMRAKRAQTEEPLEFPLLVQDAYDKLRAEHGDDAFVWKGELLSVSKLVAQLLEAAKRGERGIGGYLPLRHRLEAWTGMDCRSFFYAGAPRHLEIAAALESFLESGEADRYAPGQRYFWGHAIE